MKTSVPSQFSFLFAIFLTTEYAVGVNLMDVSPSGHLCFIPDHSKDSLIIFS
jgi:hypothetical protein